MEPSPPSVLPPQPECPATILEIVGARNKQVQTSHLCGRVAGHDGDHRCKHCGMTWPRKEEPSATNPNP